MIIAVSDGERPGHSLRDIRSLLAQARPEVVMNLGEDVRLLIAANFITIVEELEKVGIRRDLVLDGMERALQMLKQREHRPKR